MSVSEWLADQRNTLLEMLRSFDILKSLDVSSIALVFLLKFYGVNIMELLSWKRKLKTYLQTQFFYHENGPNFRH